MNSRYKPMSVETRLKLSEAQDGSKRAVIMFDLDYRRLDDFDSVSAASRLTGVPARNIIACCRGRRFSAGEYIWRYEIE